MTGTSSLRRTAATLVAGLVAALAAMLTFTASAHASINRGSTWSLSGTDCRVTVGGYPNGGRYPGTATLVFCNSPHTIQIRNQLWWAGTNGVPYLYGQSGWYSYYNRYGSPEVDTYWAACPGTWDWQSRAQIYIDGVYRGTPYNAWGWWTACT